MSPITLSAVIFGAGIGAGLVWLAVIVRGGRTGVARPTRRRRLPAGMNPRTVAVAVLAAVVMVLLTRWVIAGAAAVAVVMLWPMIFGGAAVSDRSIARMEAVATWTESVRDLVKGGIGLEETIPASAQTAPAIIRPHLSRLAGNIAVRVDLRTALQEFADDIDDESVDVVVAALILNSQLQGPELVQLLTTLSTSLRQELDMRTKIETQRKGLRRQARSIVVVIGLLIIAQAVFARGYVEPYGTVTGQILLAVFVVMWIGAFIRIRVLSEPPPPRRILDRSADAGALR
ncbi:type II secretion system F family protein [Solicola gregarius]|uniref:Type II secretion system protein GspF domain-containing protein n=1 Tax=Solicola gregarius TaxID=2908642 RepID=A0AA46TJK8_9ACTN|nr:type II secretion system F family protein [Solicola gregarius]UYM06318.1 hypothetical protein L0C25_04360 [Solicola gregarius]